MSPGPAGGGRIGGAIANLLGEQVVKARAMTAPHEQAARDRGRDSFLEGLESHLTPLVAGLARQVVDDPGIDQSVKDMWAPLVDPTKQFDAISMFLATVVGIFGIASAILTAEELKIAQGKLAQMPIRVLSPPEAATAFVKGALDFEGAANQARNGGIDEEKFRWLVNMTGNPPGPGELLALLRRGFINDARFEQGIRQGLSRSDWMAEWHNLRREFLSTSQVAEAVVQGHMPMDFAAAYAATWGVEAGDFETMVATAGAPLSRTELEELWNRGEVDQATVEQALRESRLKQKYVPAALRLRRRIPPERSVVMMLVRGVIDHDTAVHKLMELGYDADDAAAFVAEGSARKTAHHKELAQGEVLAAYSDGLIPAQQAADLLGRLGFTSDEAGFILGVADHRRDRANTEAAIVRIRSLYVGRKIERSGASGSLDRLAVPSEQRDRLIKLWDVERDATVKVLTLGELNAAAARGFIGHDDYAAKAGHLGYASDDAELLFAIATTNAQGALRPNLAGGGP